MAIPKEEQGHSQNRDAVFNFIRRDKMTGRVDQEPVLVEGLPKAGKERHVLAGRPDGPVANPDQQLGRRVDKPIKKARQPDLSPGVCRQGKLYTLEFGSLDVRLRPDDVALTLTRGITAPRAPAGRFCIRE